jgi:hypothetical protein
MVAETRRSGQIRTSGLQCDMRPRSKRHELQGQQRAEFGGDMLSLAKTVAVRLGLIRPQFSRSPSTNDDGAVRYLVYGIRSTAIRALATSRAQESSMKRKVGYLSSCMRETYCSGPRAMMESARLEAGNVSRVGSWYRGDRLRRREATTVLYVHACMLAC